MDTPTRKRPRSTAEDDIGECPPPQSSTPDITNDKEWTKGDFELISADRVRFLVPSYHLLSARYVPAPRQRLTHSSVFRDAAAIDTKATSGNTKFSFTLDDELIESAAVLRHVLDLACNGHFWEGYWLSSAHLVIGFLKKWDFAVSLGLLMRIIKEHAMKASPEVSPLRAFAMAAIIGWETDARDILRLCNFGEHEIGEKDRTDAEYDEFGGNSLNPDRFPTYMYTDVPWQYSWALARTHFHFIPDDVPGEAYEDVFGIWLGELNTPTHVGCKALKEPTGEDFGPEL
jgi:hypothetical protein